MAMLQDVGLNVTLQMYEVGRWNEFFVKPYPEDRRVTLTEQMHDNAKGDPVFTAFVKHHSQGAHAMVEDPELDALIEQATAASGEERAELWKQVFARANEHDHHRHPDVPHGRLHPGQPAPRLPADDRDEQRAAAQPDQVQAVRAPGRAAPSARSAPFADAFALGDPHVPTRSPRRLANPA